jgi:hypothetical protein
LRPALCAGLRRRVSTGEGVTITTNPARRVCLGRDLLFQYVLYNANNKKQAPKSGRPYHARRIYDIITAKGAVIIRIEVPCDFFAYGENAHG